MPLTPPLDDVGEQLLAELWQAPVTPAPRLFQIDDGLAIGTHVGNKRSRNEDRVVIARVDFASHLTYSAYILCDGVGGSQHGDEAAAITCAKIVSQLSAATSHHHPSQLLPHLIRGADDAVRLLLSGRGQTTLCVMLNSSKGECAIASIGDSRAYSWDHGSALIQLTEDDTLANEIKHYNLEQARTYLNARGLEASLSQAIGEPGRTSSELKIDILTEQSLPPGGILLASDGAWINETHAFDLIAKNSRSASELVRRLLTTASWLGGSDNASAISIKDARHMPTIALHPLRNTRITMWSTEKQVVAYRPATAFSLKNIAPPDKQTKKRRKKVEIKIAQSQEPDLKQIRKEKKIIAGPDDA